MNIKDILPVVLLIVSSCAVWWVLDYNDMNPVWALLYAVIMFCFMTMFLLRDK